jgi:hypothetical protein
MSMCEACQRGDHANCGMQTWCDCEDTRDGDHTMGDIDPTLWCNGCGARTQADCDCGPIAENN